MTVLTPPVDRATEAAARPGVRWVGPLLGLVAGWTALRTWSGLVVDPLGFLLPALVGGALLVGLGVGLRTLRAPAPLVAGLQLLLAALVVHASYVGSLSTALVPRPSSVAGLAEALVRGADALATRTAPVAVDVGEIHLLLTGCGLLLLWGVDVLAWSLGRPSLAALPLLVGISVPITVLVDAVSVGMFVVMAVAYVLLLAADHGGRRRGAEVAESYDTGPGTTTTPPRMVRPGWVSAGIGAAQVAGAAVLCALLVGPLVPVGQPFGPASGVGGGGSGDGGGLQVTTQNPFVSLRRDLLEQTDTPMVYARTDATSTSYLRTAVLDSFSEESWNASTRLLPADNLASGVFPAPEGVSAGTGGVESEWELRLAPGFSTRWLPLPTPLRELTVDGEWRYDQRFLDVALPSGRAEDGLRYSAVAFAPAVTGRSLDRAISPPEQLRRRMTVVPDELPPVIAERAREVTAGAETPFQQAVALQDWFREDGGFRYSLEARPGEGLDLLADFVTDDRVGYCEQFAAAMAAMGRTLGIPSRVAVGFLSPERVGDDVLRYTSDDRHAWPEMFFTGVGWVRFEPTPSARTGISPDYTRDSLSSSTPSAAPAPVPVTPEEQQAQQDAADAAASGWGGGWQALAWLLGLVLLAVALALPRVVRRRQRAGRLDPDRAGGPDEGAWEELRATALDAGVAWDDARSPREQAHALVRTLADDGSGRGADHDDAERLELLLGRVERGRYGRRPAGAPGGGTATATRPDVTSTVATVERWSDLLADHQRTHRSSGVVGAWSRVRSAVLPASLLRRR